MTASVIYCRLGVIPIRDLEWVSPLSGQSAMELVKDMCLSTKYKLYVKFLEPTDIPFPKANKLKSSSSPALEPSSFNKTSSLDKPISDNVLLLRYFASLRTTPFRDMDADD